MMSSPVATAADLARVWLITGCSSGFGRAIASRAAEEGGIVVATARNPETLAGLGSALHLCLDVTEHEQVQTVVGQVVERFGRIDVLVNNAGYGIVGTTEEVALDDVRRLFETNLLGQVALVQAVLPHMRARKSGTIVQMSSSVGSDYPLLGYYAASKLALSVISESLATEVAHLGIRILIVEPGSFRTQWATNLRF